MRKAIIDGFRQLVSRPIYLIVMVVVPMVTAWFLIDLMREGLPLQLPTAIVDLDHTTTSRRTARNLAANELVDVVYSPETYHDAMELLRKGKIYGFFMIPSNFERDAVSGKETTITYYVNLAYYVPGSLSFKSFKQTAVTTTGSIMVTSLVSAGVDEGMIRNMIQPVVTQVHPYGNPWTNYSIYLSNSFIPCALQLIIFQITAFSFLQEIKRGSSIRWIQDAGGSIVKACFGKLIPQYLIFATVGMAMLGMLYGFSHFPLNGSTLGMVAAMLLFIAASQAFALTICSIIPNLRFALSILSLIGILSFSIAGFSFPVEQMYGGVGIFSYILPIRYYFLIYINTALNGYELYYCRWEFVGLIVFLALPFTMLWKLKRYAYHPVYIP
ncbi:ABC transporter permease [Muribaculum intestinale]|uniref:ABC transporter permease n=2 Tax=Muribaculum intestinale TaxID=1796646 RepID=UPI000F47E20C|nr:ABC transporter permease [Muribaculum intestinale]ROT11384.1 ABC transporter permease [Muribaculaceae bacterium Isolate-100 (HZI)]RXE67397.1 ABC transporter permease [Muribaculaceae bacterium Isolate-007 (NCI)]